MKTAILILIVIAISFFTLRSLFNSFKGKSGCNSCPSKTTCTSKKNKAKK